MNPACRLRPSDYYMAHAMDESKNPATRLAAWRASETESWFEAVTLRNFPLMAVPTEFIAQVRHLIFHRIEGGFSGTQVRK